MRPVHCRQAEAGYRARNEPARGDVLVALAGSPNVGKSSVFNPLTGLSQHVGNWAGKTVEEQAGTLRWNGRHLRIVDLPGTCCLTANSTEEQIARDYILAERPDVVVAILNAANLERTLYLVAELLELPVPVVIGLNMMDVAEGQGMRVEAGVLQAALGAPVVPMVATRGEGLAALLPQMLTPAAGLVFLVVQMLFVPCVGALATIRQETHSWRGTAFSVAYLASVSFAAGIAVYQVARLPGLGM